MVQLGSRLPHEPRRPRPRRAGVLNPSYGAGASVVVRATRHTDNGQRTTDNGQRTKMLKVLQLIPTLDCSGAEKQMAMLAKGLPRDRFRVEVAALTRSG